MSNLCLFEGHDHGVAVASPIASISMHSFIAHSFDGFLANGLPASLPASRKLIRLSSYTFMTVSLSYIRFWWLDGWIVNPYWCQIGFKWTLSRFSLKHASLTAQGANQLYSKVICSKLCWPGDSTFTTEYWFLSWTTWRLVRILKEST